MVSKEAWGAGGWKEPSHVSSIAKIHFSTAAERLALWRGAGSWRAGDAGGSSGSLNLNSGQAGRGAGGTLGAGAGACTFLAWGSSLSSLHARLAWNSHGILLETPK